jgi:hypothetical protein
MASAGGDNSVMSTIRFALALSIAASISPALAQSSRSTMNSYNDNNFTTNGQQQITGAKANAMNDMIINSMGVLGDTNTWTGSNAFNGAVSFPGLPNVQHGDPIPATGKPYINASGFLAFSQ